MHQRSKVLLIALGITLCTHCSAVAQDKTFFQRLQDSAFELLGITGTPALHGEVEITPMVMEMERAPVEPVEQQQATTDRLRATLQANADWIKHQCPLDAAQEQAAQQLVEELILQSQQGQRVAPQQQQAFRSNLRPTSPVLFAGLNGIGYQMSRQFIEKLHQKVLNDTQKETLGKALDERRQKLQTTWKDYLILLLDEELFLTPEQIAACSKELSSIQVQHALYAFRPMPYFLPYESIQEVVSDDMGSTFLDERQQAHLKNLLTAEPNQNVITIDASMNFEQMEKTVTERSTQFEQHLLLCTAVRIRWYSDALKLEPEKIRQLELAAKGAAKDAATEWRDSTGNSIENIIQNIEQFAGSVSMGVAEPPSNPSQNSIWASAIKATLPDALNNPVLAGRNAASKQIRAEVLLALLDEELWLTAEQRKSLLPLIANTLPQSIPSQYPDYFREITLLAYPVTRMVDDPRNTILTPQQQAVWGQLAAFFRIRKEIGQGAVEFLMQDMGNWTLMLGE